MDRAEAERVLVRVDEEGEAVVPRSRAFPGVALFGPQLAVGSVPVVAVGDERRARGQVRDDGRLRVWVGDRPQPVRDAVVGDRAGQRRLAVRREVRQPGRVTWASRAPAPAGARPAVIDEQDGLKVALCCLHELTPPGDRARHHPFMREHRVRPHPDKPDEAALHPVGAPLLVDVQRGRVVDRERALRQPVAQPRGGGLTPRPRVTSPVWGPVPSRVTTLRAGGRAAGRVRRQDEPDNVVGRVGEQPLQGPGANHVVRW